MSKPSLILVPGSFALPEFYDNIIDPLKEQGYDVHALHLPSVGLKTGPRPEGPHTLADDAAFIANVTEKLSDEGKDVVIMGHSYGGIPVTESVKGLEKAVRGKAGKKGGITRLAYMTCLVPEVGGNAVTVLANVSEEHRLVPQMDAEGWMHQDPVKAAPITFSDLPFEEGLAWMKRFPAHSAVSFAGEVTYPGYKDVPSSYLLCTADLVIPPSVQKDGIEMIERVSGNKVDVTTIAAGHCPSATQPEKVIEWLVDVLSKA